MSSPSLPSPGGGEVVRGAIGSWLREHRRFLGLSQEDLRRRLERRGIRTTQSTVSRWEKGELAPPGDVLPDLAAVLGTTLDDLEERVAVARCRAGAPIDVTGRPVRDLREEAEGAAHAGNVPRAVALLEAARDRIRLEGPVAGNAEELSAVLLALARGYLALWHLGRAGLVLRQLAAVDGLPDRVRFQARLLRLVLAEREGDPETHDLLLQAIQEELPAVEDRELRCHAQHVVGGSLYVHGQWMAAVPFLEEAAAGWRSLGRRPEELRARVTLGFCRARAEDPSTGEQELRDALAGARSAGYRETEARALLLLGRLQALQSREPEGIGLLEDAAVLARRLGLPDLEFVALYHGWRAAVETHRDEADDFERRLRRVLPAVHPRLPEAVAFRAEADPDGNSRRRGEEERP